MRQVLFRNSAPSCPHDPLMRQDAQVLRHATGTYPPFDIIQTDDRCLRIIVSVAGSAMDDLSVSVAGKTVVIRGRRPNAGSEMIYLHRGIAMRQFQRTFALDDAVEVKGASLDRGLLTIELEVQVTQPPIRTITIGPARTASSSGKFQQVTSGRTIAR